MSRRNIVTTSLIIAGILFSSFAAAQLVTSRNVKVAATSYDNIDVLCAIDRHFVLSEPARPFGTNTMLHPLEIDLCGGR